MLVSYYRIWRYRCRSSCKHIYFKGRRPFGRLGGRKKGEEPDGASSCERSFAGRLPENLCRARTTVRNLILCNPFQYFCTFTFDPAKIDRMNLEGCMKRLTKLFMHYRERYAPSFRYIVIPEFHKDGAVHFHGMLSGFRSGDLVVPDKIYKRIRRAGGEKLELVPNTRRYVDWPYYSQKLGFFSCSAVRDQEACAIYVSKYITKDLAQLPKGIKSYYCSKGLERPELVFDCDDVPCAFRPVLETKYCALAYLPESWGGLVPSWVGECCSDLSDPIGPEEPEDATGLWGRMTGKQLMLMGAR